MIRYPKYATTVIGAHSVPDWYEALDRLVAVGQLSMGARSQSASGCPYAPHGRERARSAAMSRATAEVARNSSGVAALQS